MYQIQSERLSLAALSYHQLMLLLKGRNELEKSLHLTVSDFELNADDSFLKEFHEAIAGFVLSWVKDNPENFQWFTHWLIIEKRNNITIGGIGATGLPDENGQTMIGYFIDKKSEGKGYATEAVKLLTNWMAENPSFKSVIADTPLSNKKSQKVLQKAGFLPAGEVDEGLRWRLTK